MGNILWKSTGPADKKGSDGKTFACDSKTEVTQGSGPIILEIRISDNTCRGHLRPPLSNNPGRRTRPSSLAISHKQWRRLQEDRLSGIENHYGSHRQSGVTGRRR